MSTLTNAANGHSNGYVISGLQNGATISGVVTSRAKDVATYTYTEQQTTRRRPASTR